MMLLSCFAAKKMVVFTMQLVANPVLRYPFFYYSRRIVVSATRQDETDTAAFSSYCRRRQEPPMKIKIVYEYCTAIDLTSSVRSPYRLKCRSMSSTILVADCFSCFFFYGDKWTERTVLVLQYTVYDSHTPQKIECRSLFWIQRFSTNSSCMNDEKRRIFMF